MNGLCGLMVCSALAAPCVGLGQAGCDTLLQVTFTYTVDGYSILLTDGSTNQLTEVHYYWIYGDGFVDHLGSGAYTYADTGAYQVCLSVTGVNGTDTCSSLHCETVLITGNGASIDGFALGPVPFTEALYFYGAGGDAQVTLYDAEGSVVWHGTPTAEAGRLRIEPTQLAPGAYSGVLVTADGERRFRLVKTQR